MLGSEEIKKVVEEAIDKNHYFIVEIRVKNDYIKVVLDGYKGINIKECERISRLLKKQFAEQLDTYTLEVTSPGLKAAFKVKEQYEKNKGEEVSVLYHDGTKENGILKEFTESDLVLEKKEKNNKKTERISFDEIKSVKLVLSF
jgi:ribosome maturation factor RimP